MDAAATIIFRSGEARPLFEGGYNSRAAFITLEWANAHAQRRDRGNGEPSGRNVPLRVCCTRTPCLQGDMDSILGRDPDCCPEPGNLPRLLRCVFEEAFLFAFSILELSFHQLRVSEQLL